MIPREHFSSSAKKAAGQTGGKSGCSGLSAKTRGQTASGGKQLRSQVCNSAARTSNAARTIIILCRTM